MIDEAERFVDVDMVKELCTFVAKRFVEIFFDFGSRFVVEIL